MGEGRRTGAEGEDVRDGGIRFIRISGVASRMRLLRCVVLAAWSAVTFRCGVLCLYCCVVLHCVVS